MRRRAIATAAALLGLLAFAQQAPAATLSVDDDREDCPAAGFARVQDAIDAADPGDVIAICPGTYPEGSGGVGTNALTIVKSLTLRGAGADLVKITPRPPAGGRIAAPDFDLRDGVGDLVAVVGTPTAPVDVTISGVTLDGDGTFLEAGLVFIDARGTLVRSRITDIVTSESADPVPGGWRGPQPGFGVVHITRAAARPANATQRTVSVINSRIDRYNQGGILVEGLATAVDNRLVLDASEVVGRVLCQNFAANGNCSAPGLVTTGPLFGQDGVRVAGSARAAVRNSSITQNLVNGTGAPVRQTWNTAGTVQTNPGTDGNANLPLGAGVRLLGADAANSLIERTNILDNAYGVINVLADGTTANPVAVPAEQNWWGLRFTPGPGNLGPAISPAFNPPIPENPVNGAPTPDEDDATKTTSTAVDFFPYRAGPQSDPQTGQFANIQAPQPISDAGPALALTAPATVARGTSLTVTATASDDIGVAAVRFFQGTEEIGRATAPPYAATLAIPADAPCGPLTLTALAFDTLGQTTLATATTTVTGVDECRTPPPAPPTGSLPDTLNRLPQAGTAVTVTAAAAAGVARVELLLGDRSVCTLTTAPYTCTVRPTLGDVGLQSLRAVITDAAGQTATVGRQVLVPRFASRGLSIGIDRSKRKRTLTARIRPPAGESAAAACPDGTITFVISQRGRALFNVEKPLKADCTARFRFTASKARRLYSVSARFPGNTVLLPTSTSRRFS